MRYFKLAKPLAKIAAEGNRKRSEAAKAQHANSKPYAGEKMVADHSDLRPSSGKNVAREARASQARVSTATMGRLPTRFLPIPVAAVDYSARFAENAAVADQLVSYGKSDENSVG